MMLKTVIGKKRKDKFGFTYQLVDLYIRGNSISYSQVQIRIRTERTPQASHAQVSVPLQSFNFDDGHCDRLTILASTKYQHIANFRMNLLIGPSSIADHIVSDQIIACE